MGKSSKIFFENNHLSEFDKFDMKPKLEPWANDE